MQTLYLFGYNLHVVFSSDFRFLFSPPIRFPFHFVNIMYYVFVQDPKVIYM